MPLMMVSLVSSSTRTVKDGSSMASLRSALPSFSSSFLEGGVTLRYDDRRRNLNRLEHERVCMSHRVSPVLVYFIR